LSNFGCGPATLRNAPFQISEVNLAYIALGSNLGDSRNTVLRAINRLEELSQRPMFKSSLWETEPVDCPPGSPPFINAVVALVPSEGETPESLLTRLHEIEAEFGRARSGVVNEARKLDLDLIAFGEETRTKPPLLLPHPRAHLRRFVLEPLCELNRDLVLPGHIQTVTQLLGGLPTKPQVRRLAAPA
jgi:2-amino-4-hydroxy-6-hydroxymethyldihydropteridine diphosphokinase